MLSASASNCAYHMRKPRSSIFDLSPTESLQHTIHYAALNLVISHYGYKSTQPGDTHNEFGPGRSLQGLLPRLWGSLASLPSLPQSWDVSGRPSPEIWQLLWALTTADLAVSCVSALGK